MTPRPSYLRPQPRILDPGFLRRPTPGADMDPGFTPRFNPGADTDPGFTTRPLFEPAAIAPRSTGPVRLPYQPRLRLSDPSQIQPATQSDAPVGAADAPTSLKDRLSLALEGAGRAGTLDPNSEDSGTEAFLGSALKAFSSVRGFQRQMSANQQAQQDKATERKSQQDLREAQAEYYRGRAHATPTGETQHDRIELENLKHGHLLERIRTAADLRRRQASTRQGQVTQGERVILGRTERADVAGSRAVENERSQATRGYRDPLAPGEENDIMARIRRQTDPNYVSDSTAVADVINPKLGVPRPAAPATRQDPLAPGSRTRSILEDYLRRQNPMRTSRPALPPAPPLEPSTPSDQQEEVDTTDTTPDETVDQTDNNQADQGDDLSDDEIDSALSMIQDIDDAEATNELTAAGYTDEQVQRVLARRKSD